MNECPIQDVFPLGSTLDRTTITAAIILENVSIHFAHLDPGIFALLLAKIVQTLSGFSGNHW